MESSGEFRKRRVPHLVWLLTPALSEAKAQKAAQVSSDKTSSCFDLNTVSCDGRSYLHSLALANYKVPLVHMQRR